MQLTFLEFSLRSASIWWRSQSIEKFKSDNTVLMWVLALAETFCKVPLCCRRTFMCRLSMLWKMSSVKSEHNQNTARNNLKAYGKVILTLKNQLLPDDKLITTPSQTDGLDGDTETDLRIYGCELIQTAGILLKLPQVRCNF